MIANNGFYGLGFDPLTSRLLGAVNNGINPSNVLVIEGQTIVDSFGVGTFQTQSLSTMMTKKR